MKKFVGIMLGGILAFLSAASVSPAETDAISLASELTTEEEPLVTTVPAETEPVTTTYPYGYEGNYHSVNIAIDTLPVKTEYKLYEELDLTGLTVHAMTAIHGSYIAESFYGVDPADYPESFSVYTGNFNPAVPGEYMITVTYIIQPLEGNIQGNLNASFNVTVTDETPDYTPGDINSDGKVSLSDSAVLQKYLSGSESFTGLQLLAADLNGDGRVNVFDAVSMKRRIIQNQPEYTVRTDMTNAAYQTAWDDAMKENKTAVVTSAEELDSYLTQRFRSSVVRSLEKTYDEEFFSENVLILDLYAQNSRDDWETEVSGVFSNGETIEIRYDNIFIDGWVNESLMITQVAVPKSGYNGEKAVHSKSWEKNISALNTEYDLGMLSEVTGKQINEVFTKEGVWVNSAEGLDAYLRECLTEDGMAEAGSFIKSSMNFDKESVYIWMDTDIIGSTHNIMNTAVMNTSVFGNYIDLTYSHYQPVSCMGGSFLHVLRTDKEYSGKTVKLRSFLSYSSGVNLRTDGELFRYYPASDMSNYKTLFINQYSFGSEGAVDFYWAYPGGGGSEFSGFENVGSLEVPVGTLPFSEDYTEEIDADGNTVYTGENFSITWQESSVAVKFRTKDSTEMTSFEIPY